MTRLIRARGGSGANCPILFKVDLKEDDLVIVGVNVVVFNAGLAEIGEAFFQVSEGCIVLFVDQFQFTAGARRHHVIVLMTVEAGRRTRLETPLGDPCERVAEKHGGCCRCAYCSASSASHGGEDRSVLASEQVKHDRSRCRHRSGDEKRPSPGNDGVATDACRARGIKHHAENKGSQKRACEADAGVHG